LGDSSSGQTSFARWFVRRLTQTLLLNGQYSNDYGPLRIPILIRIGQALIILDGLDEVPVSNQRSEIINIVENFVETYVQTPKGVSVFDNVYLSKLLDDPSRSEGNQLIITSCIVGYHAATLVGQFSHYTIRPMNMEYMKDFIDYWFFRVHQRIIDTLDLSLVNQGENHGEALKKELENIKHTALLDVASNFC
ncbi:unnamed protein product, partial [Rotaria sp. Silwood1]